MSDNQEFLARSLPKWPQLLLSGNPISRECALEIIRRTDMFFGCPEYSGNNKAFCMKAIELLKYPLLDREAMPEERRGHYEKTEAWRKAWGIVDTSYMTNSWISSSFVGGPHGWCSPQGRLHFVHNVGKWPDIKDVLADLRVLADAFPILHMDAVLMNEEACEDGPKCPVVGFLVRGTEVELVDGNDERIWQTVPDPYQSGEATGGIEQMMPGLLARLQTRGDPEGGSGENYFTISQMKEMWSEHIPKDV